MRKAKLLYTRTVTATAHLPLWRDIVVGSEPPGTLSSPLILGLGYSHTLGEDDEE